MELTLNGLRDKQAWTSANIALPPYDVAALQKKTCEEPRWVHFGIGNIFRIFLGSIADDLIARGLMDTGIT